MLKIGWSQDHLSFNMGIPLLVTQQLCIEMAPWCCQATIHFLNNHEFTSESACGFPSQKASNAEVFPFPDVTTIQANSTSGENSYKLWIETEVSSSWNIRIISFIWVTQACRCNLLEHTVVPWDAGEIDITNQMTQLINLWCTEFFSGNKKVLLIFLHFFYLPRAIKGLSTIVNTMAAQIAKFMWPSWGPSGSCGPQVGPTLAPRILLSGCWWYWKHPTPWHWLSFPRIFWPQYRMA